MTTEQNHDTDCDDAFVIIDLPVKKPHQPMKADCEDAPVTHRTPSDEMYSRNGRIDAGVACAEPIYKDGKRTGEYRICRRPRHWDDGFWTWTKQLPWEGTVSSRQEALAWLKKIRDSC